MTNTAERPSGRSESGSGLGGVLADETYRQLRLRPALGSADCLILTDLLLLMGKFAKTARGRLLDYGCGGAPYKPLFDGCSQYVGADVTPGPEVDHLLAEDGSVPEPPASFDHILSSQVLEHVPAPERYLAECFRLLKPGGELLLTTHGLFHEHGCPHDYHRWTARGLEVEAEQAGFELVESWKITCGIRCVIQTMHYLNQHLRSPQSSVQRLVLAVCRRVYNLLLSRPLNFLARAFPTHALLPGSDSVSLYVGVGILARKPNRG